MGIFFNRNKKKFDEELEKQLGELIKQSNQIKRKINAEIYANFVVVEYIAREFSKCRINCYRNNEIQYDEDYYRWNVKPNSYQNAAEFKKELASKLLIFNEVLIIEKSNNDLVIADSFESKRYGTNGYTFSSVQVGDERFVKTFRSGADDVIYITYSNDNVNIRQKVAYLLSGLQELISIAKDNFTNSSYQKGILMIDAMASGNKPLQEKITKLLNEGFADFFSSNQNSVLPLYQGMTYKDLNDDRSSTKKSEVEDIRNVINEMISKSAIAYGIHPSAILGNVENTENAEQYTISKALKPIAELLENAITESVYKVSGFVKGDYVSISLAPVIYSSVFENADASDKLIASGQYSIDDLIEARGGRRLNNEWSTKHWMTLNYRVIEDAINQSAKGGENDGKTE